MMQMNLGLVHSLDLSAYYIIWIPDIINEMSKMEIRKIGNIWSLNELIKKQRDA